MTGEQIEPDSWGLWAPVKAKAGILSTRAAIGQARYPGHRRYCHKGKAIDMRMQLQLRRAQLIGTTLGALPGAWTAAAKQGSDSYGVNYLFFHPGRHLSARGNSDSIVQALADLDTPHIVHAPFEPKGGDRSHPTVVYPVTIAKVQLANNPLMALESPRFFSSSRHRISFGDAETESLGPLQRLGAGFVDEAWTVSEFCRTAYESVTDKPVRIFPLPVDEPRGRPGQMRRRLGLGQRFIFGFQFDMASTIERKNPIGLMEAFSRAFPASLNGPVLVVKTVNGREYPAALDLVLRVADGRPDIIVVDEFWTAELNQAFFLDIDAFVSLHRAEGFGLSIAQAMAAGRPVIGTGYSGNLDFMSESNSILVPFRMCPIGDNPLYGNQARWAVPDLDYAADAMRTVYSAASVREQLGAAAAESMRSRTRAASATWLRQHLPEAALPPGASAL